MYIYDCLYGEMDFDKIVYQCMLTPEMQRLREVRLGNINSLFLTGSANINRFEHSVGTAYLAKINVEYNNKQLTKQEKNKLILAALFHDIANGPFGHSYEYLCEKQGFNPEKNIGSVINCIFEGAYKKSASLETIYFGQYNQIGRILKKEEVKEIDNIVAGKDKQFSKLISDVIDLDNIDNVFRMAYHMGISFAKQAPIELAQGMMCEKNEIYFKENVLPYLYEWYYTRIKVYKMLLYNPQDFAAKCMLSEIMEVVLKNNPTRIKWYYTDYQFVSLLKDMEEIWTNQLVEVKKEKDINWNFEEIQESKEHVARILKEGYGLELGKKEEIEVNKVSKKIGFAIYNTEYELTESKLLKVKKGSVNVTNIVTRMMTGDLYGCLAIMRTKKLEYSESFLDMSSRCELEEQCNNAIYEEIGNKDITIAFHAIVDRSKTKRQLNIKYLTGEEVQIGESTREMLIGVFIKNPKYGLSKGKKLGVDKRKKCIQTICAVFGKIGLDDLENVKLYDEVKEIE